jgi:hypothetical protein
MVEDVVGGVSFKLLLEFTSTSLCVFEVCEARVPEGGYLPHACWEVQGVWLISDLPFPIVKVSIMLVKIQFQMIEILPQSAQFLAKICTGLYSF